MSIVYKVILIGDAGVGKTELLKRLINGDEYDNSMTSSKPTIGIEFGTKTFKMNDSTEITVQIWDTAGQERYRAITRAHYRRANGAFVVYDTADLKSFDAVADMWLDDLKKATSEDVQITIVGNKVDLPSVVTEDQHQLLVRAHKVKGFRASVKTGENVRELFRDMIERIHKTRPKNFPREKRMPPETQGSCC